MDTKHAGDGIEILNSGRTRERLEALVNEAERYVFLVSPYVTLDKLRSLVRSLHGALARKVKVKLVFREKDVSSNGVEPLASDAIRQLHAAGMELRVLKDLHAKVYFSEKAALLSSMNLLDSSFNNSIEVGTWVPAAHPAYGQIAAFLRQDIHPTSHLVTELPRAAVLSAEGTAKPKQKRGKKAAAAAGRRDDDAALDELFDDAVDEGTCIRCGAGIAFDTAKPLCRDCYAVWKEHEDEDYPEKYCLRCGEKHKTSFARPLCRECWAEA